MIRTFPDGIPSYTGYTENAMLVALQDGDGPWSALTGTGGVYHATVTNQRYSVAVGCTSDIQSNVFLYYQAVSDTTDILAPGCPSSPATVHVSVDIQGFQTEDSAEVWLGRTRKAGPIGAPIEMDVPKGTVDVFARTYIQFPGNIVILFRGATLDLQADQSLTIDIGTSGLPPEPHALTLIGLDPEDGSGVNSSYATPHSLVQWPLLAKGPYPDTMNYVTIDAKARQPDDISHLTIFVGRTAADGRDYQRLVRVAMKDPVAQTVQLPGTFTADTPIIDRTSAPRVTVTIPITVATSGITDYEARFSTSANGVASGRALTMFLRPGWAEKQPCVTIVTPDLSNLPGWTANMALTSGVSVDWRIERSERNMPFETLPVDGRHITTSIIAGHIDP